MNVFFLGEAERQMLQPPEEVSVELAAEVFGNDLIREIIVNHVIHKSTTRSTDRAAIFSVHSLGKGWNDSVCKLLHRHGNPLYDIKLADDIQLNSVRRGEQCGECFNKFTKTFATSSDILGRTPTYSLSICDLAFQRENYESLYNFLRGCGKGLVEISLEIPRNGGSMKGMFPNLSLPSVKEVYIDFNDTSLNGQISHSDNVTYLLQSIFNGSTALKELTMCDHNIPRYQSSVFECIVLPPTLTKISLEGEFGNEDVEILFLKNFLPNLAHLTLCPFGNPMEAGLLTRILQTVRTTLKSLCLYSRFSSTRPLSAVLFRFPVMERLETFQAMLPRFELEHGIRCLETYLPKLKSLEFFDQSADMIRNWTKRSRVLSVETLHLKSKHGMESLSFLPESVSQIHSTFPNVTKLELQFKSFPVDGLQCMFKQMTNLVNLKITKLINPGEGVPFDSDSVLTGIPIESTALLREKHELWNSIPLNNDEDPSIRKLTELCTLSIGDYWRRDKIELMTDLSFNFGFLRMPRLQKLEFSSVASVSFGMAEQWQMTGRLLNNIELPPMMARR